MNNVKKPNDWFIAQIDNPSFTPGNFRDVGLTADNTGLLDRNTYKNSKYVQDKFKDDEGKFDEVSFNKVYDAAAQTYQKFANDEFEESIMDDADWDPYSQLRPEDGKVRDINFNVTKVLNPDRLKTGVSQIGRTDNREWTASELAQTQKVYDYKTGKYKEYTPNDNILFGNPVGFLASLGEPLVLAQWDEDGEHTDPFTGRVVKHNKGDLKYNDEGTYYYETLGGREAYGRKFKSAFDSFTVDGSAANKYDFFDSDGLDKSVTGTVMKTVAAIAPLFVPYVNTVYGGAMIGAQLMDILPTIYKSTIGLNQDTPTANLLQGIGRTFKGSKSEYSQQNLISTENFFDLVTDVALQWAQQRTIFQGIHKLLGTEAKQRAALAKAGEEAAEILLKNPEKYKNVAGSVIEMNQLKAAKAFETILKRNNRMAANTALGYMAMMQGLETFEDAIGQGATRAEAAAIAWGAVAGMYAVDRTGLGEIFFPELKTSVPAYRQAIKEVAEEVNKGFQTLAKSNIPQPKKLAKFFDTAKKKSSDYWSDVRNHTTGFAQKMLTEGLEEMSEEAVVDLAKATFNWAQEMGFTESKNKLNAGENAFERYGMSFFGGAIGGAIFHGVDVVNNHRAANEQTNQELIYLVRNGRTNELIEELNNLKKKGKLGNKNLSATKTEDTKEGTVWTSPTSGADNQNEAVYNLTKSYFQHLDAVINQEGMGLSDEQLLDKMVMSDVRMKALASIEVSDGQKFGKAILNGYNGKMLQDFNTLTSKIVEKRNEIADLEHKTNDTDKKGSVYQADLQRLQQEYSDLQLQKQKFLDGSFSEYYTDQMLFAIDNLANHQYYAATFKDFAEFDTKQNFQDLSEEQIESLKPKYEAYLKQDKMEALDAAYGIYKKVNKEFSNKLQEGSISVDEYYKFRKEVFSTMIDLKATIDRLNLEDVTEQELQSRFGVDRNIDWVLNKKFTRQVFDRKDNESDEEAEARLQQTELYNQEVLGRVQGVIQMAQGYGFMDAETKDLLLSVLGDKISNERAVMTVLGNMFANGIISRNVDASGNLLPDPLMDKLIETLEKVNGENLEDINKEIHDVINSEEYKKQLVNATLDYFDAIGEYYESEDADNVMKYTEERINNMEKIYQDAAKEINNEVLANPYNATVLQLRSDVLKLKTSPVYDYLQDFTRTVFGSTSNIIDLIENEKRRFEAAPTVSDYILDGNKEKEIEDAITAINMLKSVIYSSSTADLDIDRPFGHNALMNYFLETYFPKEEKYGVIRDDVAAMMNIELDKILVQLSFLTDLSIMNGVNQFSKHARTGQKISKLLYDVLRGNGKYGFLKDLEYNGTKLFAGLDEISTPTLDNIDEAAYDNPAISVELANLQNKLYDTFHKIVSESGESVNTVLKAMFSNLGAKFNMSSLVNQNNTRFSPETEYIEDFDIYMWLHATLAFKKSDFDYYLRETLADSEATYAPLFAQEYAAYMSTAMAVNPEVMNAAIDNINVPKGQPGSELLKYFNTVMVNGIGGAGKTAVIAKLVQGIVTKINPNSTVWKVGPSEQQVNNLVSSLGSDGKSFTVEGLMRHVLGDETYGELSKDINSSNTESKLYDLVEFNELKQGYTVAVAKSDIEYSDNATPRLLFIDEATWVNSVYMQFLSDWASKNGVTIILLGDLNQNGYENVETSIYNVKPTEALTVRTPKLDISLRITNVQKDDNNKQVNAILSRINFNKDNVTADNDAEVRDRIFNEITSNLILKHYQDDDNPLNGEKIVNEISEEDIKALLEADGEIGYVYDNENSPTYQLIQRMNDSRIKVYTPKSVQGSEAAHFIIDVDFAKYDSTDWADLINFAKSFYTMMSRSKEGTYIINNGLSAYVKEKNLIKEDRTSVTPSQERIINTFKEIRMAALDSELEGYTPSPINSEETPQSPEPAAKAAPYTPKSPSKPKGDNPIENELLGNLDGKKTTVLDSEIEGVMSGIRAYGWYMRYGMLENEDGTFDRVVKDDIIDDLNVFTKNGIHYTANQLITPKSLLVDIRNYLTFGEKFDEDFLQRLSDSGNAYLAKLGLDVWNNGSFYLEVRKDDTSTTGTDIARDKQGYDKTKVESTAFNIVYRVSIDGGKDIQFTMGKLTNPDTWQKWDKAHGNKLDAAISKYRKWYKNMQEWSNSNPTSSKYFKINKSDITFSRATRLKEVPGQTWNLNELQEAFPNALISPMYGYTGQGGVAMIDKSVRGKGIVFATTNKHLKIDGEKVTESNLADMYIKMQKKRARAFDEAKSRGLSNEEANAEVADRVPPIIRAIIATPNGSFINDYFTLSFSDLTSTDDDGKSKLDIQQVKDYIGTYGSNTTAARMLVALWNYRAGLNNFLDAYKTYMSTNNLSEVRGQTEVDKFNGLLDQSVVNGAKRVPWNPSTYNGFMFRLTYADAIKANAPGMVVRPINLSENEWKEFNAGSKVSRKLTYGVYIDPAVAKAQYTILNEIFDVLGKYISLPKDTNFTIRTEGRNMDNILEQLISDNGEIEFSDGVRTVKHAASALGNMGGSFKVVSLLSSIYKMYTKGYKAGDAYSFTAKGPDGKPIETRLEATNVRIGEAVRDAGRTSAFSVLNNMFNVILHGTPTIKEGAPTTTYAPFIDGIFYTPRFQTSHDSQPSDFYPTRNNLDQFHIDVAIESPNFEITIDPTGLKEVEFKDDILHAKRDEFNSRMNLSTMGALSNISGYESLQDLADRAKSRYETEGDAAINDIIKEYSSSVAVKLSDAVNNRQLKMNNDTVLSIYTTVLDTGLLTINSYSTLLDEINKKSPSVLPKKVDGSIDNSAIQNVEYNGSNLEEFTVTLQGGQTIKGSILDGKVEIADTTMYEIPFDPTREQKLKIFADTLNDFDNLRESEIADLINTLMSLSSVTPEQAQAILDKAKLVDSHFEGLLTDEQLDNDDLIDVQEYISSLASNKNIIDSQGCKFNI